MLRNMIFGLMIALGAISSSQANVITTIPGEAYGVFNYGYEGVTINYGGNSDAVVAGVYTMSVDGVATNLICVDISNTLFSPGTFDLMPLADNLNSTTTDQIAGLLDNTDSGMNELPTPPTAEVSGAIQMAVWSLEYPGITYTNVDLATLALSNLYAQNAIDGTWTAPVTSVPQEYVSDPPGNQNLGFLDTTTVDEPPSVFLFIAGVLGLWGFTRLRKPI